MKLFVVITIILKCCGSIDGLQLIGKMMENNLEEADKNLRSLLIFPGTKWCGEGNIAENENDFGKFEDTDRCCKTHDMCPETMAGHETKHNLTNPNFFTRLPCDCDLKFHACLNEVNSGVSSKIGIIYFNIIGTQCYKEDYPIIRCSNYSNFLKSKCLSYELDMNKEKMYQFFDVPDF